MWYIMTSEKAVTRGMLLSWSSLSQGLARPMTREVDHLFLRINSQIIDKHIGRDQIRRMKTLKNLPVSIFETMKPPEIGVTELRK